MLHDAERIVVTGGAGFVGSHLVDRLLADTRAEVVVFDNLCRGRLANLAHHQIERRLQFVQGDIRDADAVADTLRGADVVYHLAARSKAVDGTEGLDETFTTNVVGTFNVLRAATRHTAGRVVFTSSRQAYGEPIALPVDEGHPLLTMSAYGASKVAGEAYCRVFRQVCGLQTIILRLGNVYGRRDFGRVVPIWLKQAAAGQPLCIYGGKQVLDFIGVGETVEALVRASAVDRPLPPVNVASGTGTRIVDLARRIARLVGGPGQLKLLPARAADVTRFVANVDRMRQLLTIEPQLDPLVHLPSLVAAPVGAAR